MKIRLFELLALTALMIIPVVGSAQQASDPAIPLTREQCDRQDPPDSPDASAAATTLIKEQCNCFVLLDMLEDEANAEDVVRASVAMGMNLSAATVYALECGGESHRTAIAVAGVRLANSLAQAQAIANAVLAAVGQNGDLSAALREAVALVARGLPQPNVYVDEYTPTGPEVSPAS
jgi:hypothetical protein